MTTKNFYPHGGQGTFVYSPDISVYISTDNSGVIDVSGDIVDFSLTRHINAVSTFQANLWNKYSRYDRVIQRMDRIVVFLKRISWVQVFAGYITEAPFETILPGAVPITAMCTMKRLLHTYWDPFSNEAQQLFPAFNQAQSTTSPDGGAAAAMFKLLTTVGEWDKTQLQIQKIPQAWLNQAASLFAKADSAQSSDADYQAVLQQVQKLLDADGWSGQFALPGSGSPGSPTGNTPKWNSYASTIVDAIWRRKWGKKKPDHGIFPHGFQGTVNIDFYSGHVPKTEMARVASFWSVPANHNEKARQIYLRPDALNSLRALWPQMKLPVQGGYPEVTHAYLSYDDQVTLIKDGGKNACQFVPCPAGASTHGWGTAVDFLPGSVTAKWVAQHETSLNDYGWFNGDETGLSGTTQFLHWDFLGSTKFPAEVHANGTAVRSTQGQHGKGHSGQGKVITATGPNSTASNTSGTSNTAFNVFYFYPGRNIESDAFTGERAFINDVPLMNSIIQLSNASLRDIQSAPNGDFVSFFPDKLGIWGKDPLFQIRDIEIMNYAMTISDDQLVTHYAAAGDFFMGEPHTGLDVNMLNTRGIITIEQDDVMKILLGLDPNKNYKNMPGQWMLQRFGMRPMREDIGQIRDHNWEWMLALHRFQELWSQQFQTNLATTFLPEVYPGMRIELVDRGTGLYVEAVTHTGSRQQGFSTQIQVSVPMKKTRQGGKTVWVLIPPELSPKLESELPGNFASEVHYQNGIRWLT